ncbi:MAG TPA: hypothetical protein EYH06_10460 [Chromatiales bacterium]|nr:hypothetical protein [Chromatiales bacterium]
MREAAKHYEVSIHAYVLMADHVHRLVSPKTYSLQDHNPDLQNIAGKMRLVSHYFYVDKLYSYKRLNYFSGG